jgi:hypothetical protein
VKWISRAASRESHFTILGADPIVGPQRRIFQQAILNPRLQRGFFPLPPNPNTQLAPLLPEIRKKSGKDQPAIKRPTSIGYRVRLGQGGNGSKLKN